MNGKTTSRKINAIIDNGRRHMIQNDSNMTVKGTLGKIKINLSFIFEDDAMNLFKAYPAFDRQGRQVVSFDAFYYNLMSKINPSKDLGNTFKSTRSVSPDPSKSGMMTSRSGMLSTRTRGSSKATGTFRVGRTRSLSPGPRRAPLNDSLLDNMTTFHGDNELSVIEEASREVGEGDDLVLNAVEEELQVSKHTFQDAINTRDKLDGKKSPSKPNKLEMSKVGPIEESDKENDVNQSNFATEKRLGIYSIDVILTDVVIYGLGKLLNPTDRPSLTSENVMEENEGNADAAATPSGVTDGELITSESDVTKSLSWEMDILGSYDGDTRSSLMSWKSNARFFPSTSPDEVQWNGLEEVKRVTSKDALKSFDFSNPTLTPTLDICLKIFTHPAGAQEIEKELFASANFQLPCLHAIDTAKTAMIRTSLKFKFSDESIDPSSLQGSHLGFSWLTIPDEEETITNADTITDKKEISSSILMDVPGGGDEALPSADDDEMSPSVKDDQGAIIQEELKENNMKVQSPTLSIFVLRCKKNKTDYKCIFPGKTKIGREAIEDDIDGEKWFPHWCPRDDKGAPLSKNYISRKHAEIFIEGSVDNLQIKLRNYSKGGCHIIKDPKNPSTAERVHVVEDSLIGATFPEEKTLQVGDYIKFGPGNYLFQLLQLSDERQLLPNTVEPFFGFGGDVNDCDIDEYNSRLFATYPSPLKKLTKSDVPSLGIRNALYSGNNKSTMLRSSSANRKTRGEKNTFEDTSEALVASGGNVKTVKALQQLTQQRKELEKILKEIKAKSTKYDKRLMALEKKAGLDGSSIFSGSTPGSVGHDFAISIASDKKSEARAKEQEGNDSSGNKCNAAPLMSPDGGNEMLPSDGGLEALPGDNDENNHSPRNHHQNHASGIEGHHFSDKQWEQLEAMIKKGHLSNAFTKVLDYGDFMDLSKLMTLCNGPQPEKLNITVRNKLYGRISTMLSNGKEVERNLVWILALVRQNLIGEMVRHTMYDVRTALLHTASEPSKRGMLAALLEDAIKQHQRALYGGRSS